jgi:hypothetical protein
MATDLNFAALRPLFVAAALFAFIAGASFTWGAIESQAAKAPTRVVALPN